VGDSPVAVASRQVSEPPEPPSHRNRKVGPALEAAVMTALAKQPARRFQTASAMGQALARIGGGDAAGAAPPPAGSGQATKALGRPAATSDSAPTVVLAGRAARGAARGSAGRGGRCWRGWARSCCWSGAVVAAQRRCPHRCGAGGTGSHDRVDAHDQRAATSSSTPTTAATTQAQAGLPAALVNLRQVILAGEQQGTIDPAAEDLLHQAEDVVRAVDEGHGDQVGKKLEELGRKVDELVREGKIQPVGGGSGPPGGWPVQRAVQGSG
jgi:hypothetical protein